MARHGEVGARKRENKNKNSQNGIFPYVLPKTTLNEYTCISAQGCFFCDGDAKMATEAAIF